MKGKLD